MEIIEELPQSARGLWNLLKQTRQWLPKSTGEQYWMLGGGTLLAGRWNAHGPPRQSEDLDIKIRAPAHDTVEQERKRREIAALERALRNAGGTKWELEQKLEDGPNWSQTWRFDEQEEGRIDLVELHESTPWQPARGRIENIELLLEPTAAILFGKLWRSHLALARDAFDLGVAGELDRGALSEALQVLGKARTEQAEEHIKRAHLRLEVEAQTELKGVVELWEDIGASPAQAALRAVEGCWKETEKAQLKAIANETDRIARRIRRIQLEQGTGQITVNAKRSGLDIIWSEPGEANRLVVAENVSDDDWRTSWTSLRGTPKANQLENRTEEDTRAVERGQRIHGLRSKHHDAAVRTDAHLHLAALAPDADSAARMLDEAVANDPAMAAEPELARQLTERAAATRETGKPMEREAALAALDEERVRAQAREAVHYRAPPPNRHRPQNRSRRDDETPGEL